MGEISNKTLAVLVLAALVVVVVATTLQLNQLSDLGVTGQATDSETGTVLLDIANALNIEVDQGNGYDSINFGTCTPNSSGIIIVDSNDTRDNVNCTGDATAQHIQVNNIGNIGAEINVSGECTVASWLPSAGSPDFEVAFTEPTSGACVGTLQDSYITLENSYIPVCDNLTISSSINMSVQVTIPSDTTSAGDCGGGGDQTNTITFLGWAVD